MKLSQAVSRTIAAALLVFPLLAAGCSSSGAGRTAELPGGGALEEVIADRAPNAVERFLGSDRRPNVGPCPLMGVLYDSSRLVSFSEPGVERYSNVNFTGEMQGVSGLCRYVDADPIVMNMEIEMAFGRGPAATETRRTYRYWVAVARRGSAPIEKAYFDVEVNFRRGEDIVYRTEQIEQITIPRANPTISGENFEILVGFELTPEQLAFNREGKRFRVNASAAGN